MSYNVSLITDKNGLPLPQYLDVNDKSEGQHGTLKPLTKDVLQSTKLTGSTIGSVTIPVFESLGITDTSQQHSTGINTNFSEWFLYALNTTDQDVILTFSPSNMYSQFLYDTKGNSMFVTVPTEKSWHRTLITRKDSDFIGLPFEEARFSCVTTATPTKGTFSLWLVGRE